MFSMESIYRRACSTPSDINEHLPTLREYASRCEHVTELGVRLGNSTAAFLAAKPGTLLSYDVAKHKKFPYLKYRLLSWGTHFRFIEADVLKVALERTELLFIDTWHTYDQLRQELALHSSVASKYIMLHDTVSFGQVGEDGREPGLMKAVQEFMDGNEPWETERVFTNNNGLYILKRVKQPPQGNATGRDG